VRFSFEHKKKTQRKWKRAKEGASANLLPVPPQSRLQGSHGEITMATPTWEHLLT